MKYGIITDIHNNVTALRAVAGELNKRGCGGVICCGDIIGIGPCPEETVKLVMKLPNLIAVRGNHEKYLLEGIPKEWPNDEGMDCGEMHHHRWEHGLLSAESVAFLKSLPYRADFTSGGVRVAVMHYCMDREGHFVNYKRNPDAEDLKAMFRGIDADVVIFGHNHARMIVEADRLYIDVGSLGCPAKQKNVARAGILTAEGGKAAVEPLDVEYDAASVTDMIDRIDYPEAQNIKKYFYGL